ncbi:MAG: LysM peptidoglycan-binding domain-containing protein, partial [Selenomonas sp.]|nr:LysM peptidoglycan-binding domain-containing protein [Selenomonas sp.]
MKCMKKRFFQLAVILVAAAAFMPFHLTNDYLRSSDFDTVTIKQNDSVWSLAARYTTNEKRAAELRQAIIEVNGLAPQKSRNAGVACAGAGTYNVRPEAALDPCLIRPGAAIQVQ